jgi:hypothetical protein
VDCVFFFGIIDMFTAFDNMKKAENLGKSFLGMDSVLFFKFISF